MANFEARQRRDEIVKHYYDEFASTLDKVGYLGQRPTLLDLNLEILKNGSFGKNSSVLIPLFYYFYDIFFLRNTTCFFNGCLAIYGLFKCRSRENV